MEEIDPTSPNLDGDLKALLEVQNQRVPKPEKPLHHLSILEENQNEVDDHAIGSETTDLLRKPAIPEDDFTVDLYLMKGLQNELFLAIKTDDIDSVTSVLNKIAGQRLLLHIQELCDPETTENSLHFALNHDSLNVAEHLISIGDEQFLVQDYTISVKDVQSKKTSLHIMTEKGNLRLAKTFLDRIPDGRNKDQFLQKTVLMELPGQRPRHLSSIHIAALNGNTEMIELLVDLGVDVNTKNNKNDTPILWAARNNHIPTVRRLIRLGADLQWENDKGSTPLYWAVRYGFDALAKLLIEEGKANVHQRRKLGLVSPIVLASALGYASIVEILLSNDADPNTSISGGQTALQLAAAYNNDDVINILVRHGALIDGADDSGNTPLMCAAKKGHVNAMGALIQHNANIECKNKVGHTIWDFAMDDQDEKLLRILVNLYKTKFKLSTRTFTWPASKTPLHIAALKGDVAKIKCLIELGADPKSLDLSGNTFFHVAARENRVNVIEAFIDSVDANQQNSIGEAAIQMAVKNGNLEVVQLLLKKAKLDARDKSGSTVLHVAARSNLATPQLITILVDSIVKTTSWSLVDAADERGNTALHIACRKGRTDILEPLSSLNPTRLNFEGDTPLHVLAKAGMGSTAEIFLEIFSEPGKGLEVDKQNHDGETALHIFAKMGDTDRVRLLIVCRSDLELQNSDGNTVLHELVEQSVLEPDNKDDLLQVFQTIVDEAPRWWCMKKDLHIPDDDSEYFLTYQRSAMIHLTSEIFNHDGLDVLAYGGSIGAIDMVQAIMNTPFVYKFREGKNYLFDVTNLVPATMAAVHKANRKTSQFSNTGVVGVMEDQGYFRPTSKSALDIVVKLDDQILATRILDITPIKQMIDGFWNAYQWIYGLLMIVHIVYMACFTSYSIPVLTTYFQNAGNSIANEKPSVWPMILFIIWPSLLLLFEVYYIAVRLYRSCRDISKVGARKMLRQRGINLLTLPYTLASMFFGILSHAVALMFAAFVISWFILYAYAHSNQVYTVAMIMVLGWMYTIAFTKGFETVHAFSIMLKYIVIKDIMRFLFLYIFVVLGFSFSFHALLQVAPSLAQTGWNVFFTTFSLMLGLADIFNDNFDDDYKAAGGSVLFIQIVYLGYITMATIILLNLLIAMMTDTYTEVKAKEGTTWRVGSVRLALDMEHSLPFIKKFFLATGVIDNQISYDEKTDRWMMTVPWEDVETRSSVSASEVVKSIEKLETRVNQLSHELSRQMEIISTKVERNESSVDVPGRFRKLAVANMPKSSKGRRPSLMASVKKR